MPFSRPYQVLGKARIKVHVRVMAISPVLSSGASTIASPSRHNRCQQSISDGNLGKRVLLRNRRSGRNDTSWGRENDEHRQGDEPQLVTGLSQPDLQTKAEPFFLLSQNNNFQIKASPAKPAYRAVSVRKNLWQDVQCAPKALTLWLFLGSGRGLESQAVRGDHGCAQICIN